MFGYIALFYGANAHESWCFGYLRAWPEIVLKVHLKCQFRSPFAVIWFYLSDLYKKISKSSHLEYFF